MYEINFNNLGFVPSPYDYRDVPLSAVQPTIVIPEAYKTDISKLPIWNQRKIGACVGHASAKGKQEQELEETSFVIPFSARFVYALCKSQDGLSGEGTFYRQAMKILQKYGCCTENLLPNDTTLTHADYIDLTKIPKEAYDEALKYCIKSYVQVLPLTFDTLKQAIYQNKIVLLGVLVGKEWWTDIFGFTTWAKDKILPLRPPEVVVSGHAILAYGYDKNYIYFLNSWSDQWGDKGTGWFGKDYEPFLSEAWTAIDLPDNWQNIFQLPKE